MTRFSLGIAAVGIGLALAWFALVLAGLGAFCFEGVLFKQFHDDRALAPDCFVVNVSVWMNPKIWLVSNLISVVILSGCALVTGYGLFTNRAWVKSSAVAGALFGFVLFVELAIALREFRVLGVVCAGALGGVAVAQLIPRRQLRVP